MTLGLKTITFITNPVIPGIRASDLTKIDLDKVPEVLQGWRAEVRGPSLFLVTPKGWQTGLRKQQMDPDGPQQVFEIPRANCYFLWQGDASDVETIAKGKAFVSAPFGKPVDATVPPIEPKGFLAQLDANSSQVPAGQMGDA